VLDFRLLKEALLDLLYEGKGKVDSAIAIIEDLKATLEHEEHEEHEYGKPRSGRDRRVKLVT
jgi:glutamate racemase